MSGHSKWSQIKRQKGAADVKRGKVFSKLAAQVTLAAKAGGGDPTMNPSLRLTVETARAANMPKDNIERAIKRGTGELGGAQVEEFLFEVYGPGGVGILVEGATDNHNRVTNAVKSTVSKLGGKLAAPGAVAYNFAKQGMLAIDLAQSSGAKDALELAIIDAGALDFEESGGVLTVYTEAKDLMAVKHVLEAAGARVTEATLSWEPKLIVSVADKSAAAQILNLMETLEDLEDVSGVYGNFEIIE